jgi:hypothetical protein
VWNPLSDKHLCLCKNDNKMNYNDAKVACIKNESNLLILEEENWFYLLNYLHEKNNLSFTGWVSEFIELRSLLFIVS